MKIRTKIFFFFYEQLSFSSKESWNYLLSNQLNIRDSRRKRIVSGLAWDLSIWMLRPGFSTAGLLQFYSIAGLFSLMWGHHKVFCSIQASTPWMQWWQLRMSPAWPPWGSKSSSSPIENHRLRGSIIFFSCAWKKFYFFLIVACYWEMFQTSFRCRKNSKKIVLPTKNITHMTILMVTFLPFDFSHRWDSHSRLYPDDTKACCE